MTSDEQTLIQHFCLKQAGIIGSVYHAGSEICGADAEHSPLHNGAMNKTPSIKNQSKTSNINTDLKKED